MNRTPYPGGLFVHELVSGERVILYPNSRFETHLGRLAFPAGESYGLMFLDCTNVPEFKFSGLSHDAAGSQMEWSASRGWAHRPYLTGRTVYDHQGQLRDATPAGYQFVGDDREPVSRLVAYETRHGLNEWTETGGLILGQGHDSGGLCVWDGVQLRVLDTGECYFVKVSRSGEQFCISYVKSSDGAIVVRCTRDELLALPILGTTIPIPIPEPKPMPTFANHKDVVERERAKYPASIGDAECFAITNAVALDPAVKAEGWGLCRAPSGGHGWIVNGQNYRVDKLAHPDGFINDILGSSGTGAADAQWSPNPDANGNPSTWAPAIGSVPTPVPLPSAQTLDGLVRGLIEAAVAPLRAEIAALKAQQPPAPKPVSIDGVRVAFRTANNHYVTAEDGGGGDVNATRLGAGGWEIFTLETH